MGMADFTGGTGNNNSNGIPQVPMGGGVPVVPPGSQIDFDPTEFLINYNDKFIQSGTILFRDEIIQQTLSTLIGKNKPNPLLVGPAGTGKTRIVEDIAYRLATDDPLIPDRIKGYTIYELPLSNIVAGSSLVGDLEKKIKCVIEFAEDKDNKVILFIDEIHQLCGGMQTYDKIAQILKPSLARGDLKVIGATTNQEAQNLMDDPALNRRFSRIIVDEFTQEQTVEILRQIKGSFIAHYGNRVTLDDSLLETIVLTADAYCAAGSHRPDNAITLLDRAMSDAVMARRVQELRAASDPQILQALKSVPFIPLTDRQLKTTAMRIMTGNSKKEMLNVQKLEEHLAEIKGQDNALKDITYLLRVRDLGLFDSASDGKKPLSMLFVGPSGVGKTAVTKIIAQELTGKEPIILNMTEYHSPASINRIIGSPAGYVGSDSHAELPFDCLESNPYQVILLDEFEKSDQSVQRLFMGVFEEGYLKTSKGKLVDFSKSIIFATTNAACKVAKKSLGFATNGGEEPDLTKDELIQELSRSFDAELLNRFTEMVKFKGITEETYRSIVAERYKSEIERIRKERPRIQLVDEIPDDDLTRIVKDTYVEQFGARPAGKAVRKYIEQQVLK